MTDMAAPRAGAAQPSLAILAHRLLNWASASWRAILISLPYIWLLLFFLIPFVIVLKISLAESMIARPPYSPLWSWGDDLVLQIQVTFANFLYLTEDSLYWFGYLNSLKIATISTVLCLLLGYPMAYGIARCSSATRNILLLLVILPFWTSFLLRIYAWMGMLNKQGVINNVLIWLGIIDDPITMMNTDFAVYIGIVYSYLPFMILPLYTNLERMDMSLHEAAMDLGSRPWQVFKDITLPLSVPGIIAGSLLVFIPATGEYVIPALLGNPSNPMIGRVLFDEFFSNRDWPVASAVAIVLLFLLVVPIILFQQYQMREAEGGK
jgi:putrescine transport system permease protein